MRLHNLEVYYGANNVRVQERAGRPVPSLPQLFGAVSLLIHYARFGIF